MNSIRGRERKPFRYRDYGQLATIGRKAAVAVIGKLKLSGFTAWLVWLVAHIYFLINFRNRLVVMIDSGGVLYLPALRPDHHPKHQACLKAAPGCLLHYLISPR